MIPVKLKMRNFMPYRGDVPPLSFEGIHTVCISGDNGNGKSALVDAITWALWGKTRAKSDDELIHQGQTDMEVEFDFAAGEQRYRIIRKHSKPKRRTGSGQSSLDLFIASDGGFKVISGDRISQTQQKIISLLNMDYDTFINSAFLRQGRADEFTKQPPAKRKEVLANILRLSLYDQLEERARDFAKKQQMEKAQLETAIQDIDQELGQKPEIEAELEQAQQELERLEKEINERQSGLNRLRQEKQSLENKKLQLAQLEEHMSKNKQDLERWHSQIEQRLQRIDEYQGLIARRRDIEEGYRQLIGARKINDELNQKLQQLNKMKDKKMQLEQAIHKAQASLLADHAVAQSKIAELEATSQRLPQLKRELAKLDSQKTRLAQMGEELDTKRKMHQQLQNSVHELGCSKERRQAEIKEMEEKLRLLNAQSDATCPLCETKLSRESLELINQKYDSDIKTKTIALKDNEAELAGRKMELKLTAKEVLQIESVLNKERLSLQHQAGTLTQSITEAEDAVARLDRERELLADIEKSLAAKDFAPREQAALNELESEIVSLGYDPSQHEQAAKQTALLQPYEPQQQKLEEAERLLHRETEELARAKEAEGELSQRLEGDDRKRQSLATELGALPRLEGELQQAEAEYQSLAGSQKQAQGTAGSLKGRLEHLLQQEAKRKDKEKRLKLVTKEEGIYSALALAFGKRGIQAMLIEIALPEIEAEANSLLGRMTDNRMHVKIEAQRQSRKGEPIETLDINISDELGTRNYEMYSGGEAFRIDFAIRIALSRLLARRAGAPLPTLIIDEGFGTQDSAGIEKLKEAINSIKDSFQKIIVITHIEEIKDAFPAHINVVKTAAGSTIELS